MKEDSHVLSGASIRISAMRRASLKGQKFYRMAAMVQPLTGGIIAVTAEDDGIGLDTTKAGDGSGRICISTGRLSESTLNTLSLPATGNSVHIELPPA